MIKVAHRGNTCGTNPAMENNPDYIRQALQEGYYCEADVWFVRDNFYLGHDEPKYLTNLNFLRNEKIVCHAKNIEALHRMLEDPEIHCFWHEGDSCTITSKGYIWKYPEVYFKGKLWGICSDWL